LFYLFATRAVRRKFGLNVWVERFVTNPPELRKQKFQEKNYAKNKSVGSPKIDDIPHSRVLGGRAKTNIRQRTKRLRVVGRFKRGHWQHSAINQKKETGVVPGLSVLTVC
jgi:hypothetical protein